MKLYVRSSVMVPATILVLIMLRLSWWQYNRYQEKLLLVKELQQRLEQPVVPLSSLMTAPPETLPFRRVTISGTYDFAHEIVLRNRRYEGNPGVYVLTPLRLAIPDNPTPSYVLVSRGFIPLSHASQTDRTKFQHPTDVTLAAIVKPSVPRRFLAPRDPPSGPTHPWIDAWLRADVPNIAAQLPYPLLPFYLEELPPDQVDSLSLTIVQSHSEREEMLSMASSRPVARAPDISEFSSPIPSPSTVVPAGRHRQYVVEWVILALLTILGACIMMLRPPAAPAPSVGANST